MSFESNEDPDDPLVGIKIENAGPGVARLKDFTYYVDRKPVGDIEDAIDFGKLEEVGYFEFNDDDTLAVGQQQWLLHMGTKGKGKVEEKRRKDFFDFIDHHLGIEVQVCSVVSGKCQTLCSTDNWCK